MDTETLQNAKLKTKHAVAESKKLLSMNIEKKIIAFIEHVELLELH
ncbi:hypothetical protein [Aeribacillus composti]